VPVAGETEAIREAGLRCPQCEAMSLPKRRFCAQCGSALWEPCLRCGEPSPAAESYCGACGAAIGELLAEIVAKSEAEFHEAAALAAASQFGEAVALLMPLAKNAHPRLAQLSARARGLIAEYVARRRQQAAAANDACRSAYRCLAAADFDGAARLIDAIPTPLQNGEVHDLRAKIAQQQEEIDSLVGRLQAAVRQKDVFEISSLIEELLTRKPDHSYAKSVAERVRQQLVAAAEGMMVEHRYDDALALLDQIAAWSDASNFQRLYRRIAELAWLSWDLRNSPVVDDTLLAVAERLRQLAPGDGPAVRLCDEVRRRRQVADGKQPPRLLPWARSPEQTPLGPPVEWLADFRQIDCSQAVSDQAGACDPGRFAVACGLALAGIKKAPLPINLLAGEQRGVSQILKDFVQPKSDRSAWGLDIGGSSLKAVKLVWSHAKRRAVVESAVLLEHAKPLSHAANQADEGRLISETLRRFLDEHKLGAERLCVGIPGRMALSRQVELPPLDRARLPKLIRYEAPLHFPFPIEQLAWDYQLLGEGLPESKTPASSDRRGSRALLVAAKQAPTQHWADVLRRAGLQIDLLQPDFIALHNFLAHDRFADVPNRAGDASCSVAAIDVGCDVTNIVITSPVAFWHRSSGVAGQSFTRALVKRFNLTNAQAEQQKRSPCLADQFADYCQSLAPVFDDLLKDVQQSLAAFAEAQPDSPPVRSIVALGGGFLLHGLLRRLRSGR
jgi:type IV pilus assembly protein PilM